MQRSRKMIQDDPSYWQPQLPLGSGAFLIAEMIHVDPSSRWQRAECTETSTKSLNLFLILPLLQLAHLVTHVTHQLSMALRGHVPWEQPTWHQWTKWTKKRCHTARITYPQTACYLWEIAPITPPACCHSPPGGLGPSRAYGLAHLGGLAGLGHHTPVRMLSSAQEDSTV